jgi:hypothetical protein
MPTRTNIPLEAVRQSGPRTPLDTPPNAAVEDGFAVFRIRETLWKAIVIIIVSYDEFGQNRGFRVSRNIKDVLRARDLG